MSDSMDGHFVSGHVDTTGEVIKIIENNDKSKYYFINYNDKFHNLIIEK
jgi:riboflavin synthase alpha subunit